MHTVIMIHIQEQGMISSRISSNKMKILKKCFPDTSCRMIYLACSNLQTRTSVLYTVKELIDCYILKTYQRNRKVSFIVPC